MSGQLCMRISQGHIFCPLKHLDHRFVLVDFNNTSDLFLIALHNKLYDFFIESIFYALKHDKRAVDITQS